MIVVTAPTGNIGHRVVRDLLEAGEPVRVVVRDPARLAPAVRERLEVIEGSHGDAAVIDRALNGARALFWLAPPDPRKSLDEAYVEFTRPAAEAVRRHAVPRVVSVTALGRGTRWQDEAGLISASIRMDDRLMASGAAFRGLAMPSFMDNILRQADSIRTQGLIFGTDDPDMKLPATATRDMGAVAARLLADERWTGQQDVAVLGPESLSMNDMARTVAQVLAREVRYQPVPFDAFRQQLAGRGMSESFVDGYVAMMRAKHAGMDNVAAPASVVRTPTTFRQWCEESLRPAVQR